MATDKKLVLQARELLFKRGQEGLELARQLMFEEKIPHQPLQEAVEYFITGWIDVLHPTLLGLSCEEVGGNAKSTLEVAASMVLLAGAADLHDDLIDGSTLKDSKATVFGKYGKDLTVLAGETLLFKGLYVLNEACQKLPENQRETVLQLIKQGFFGLSSAEAKEASLHGRTDVADQYYDVIKMKSAISEVTMKVGAVIGDGTAQQIEVLGHFGRTLSIVSILRDEFIDMLELAELKSRWEKECLPLPILLTLKDPEKSKKILALFSQKTSEENVDEVWGLVSESPESLGLIKEMNLMVKGELQSLQLAKLFNNDFGLLLGSLIEDL
jgi:geranylgeranyl pyrophosphate synthase